MKRGKCRKKYSKYHSPHFSSDNFLFFSPHWCHFRKAGRTMWLWLHVNSVISRPKDNTDSKRAVLWGRSWAFWCLCCQTPSTAGRHGWRWGRNCWQAGSRWCWRHLSSGLSGQCPGSPETRCEPRCQGENGRFCSRSKLSHVKPGVSLWTLSALCDSSGACQQTTFISAPNYVSKNQCQSSWRTRSL